MRIGVLLFIPSALLAGEVAYCAPVLFTDESTYLDTIGLLTGQFVFEGFEDDAAWGAVRSTIVGGIYTAPAVSSQGLVWSANNDVSQVTTGPAAARTGNWGFFQLPHGDYVHGVGDGFRVDSALDMYGFGGWVETNTPYAEVNLLLDGVTVLDFGDPVIGTEPQFFGVIDADGFREVEVREIEGSIDDQKYIFADDITIARSVLVGDYSGDGAVNAADYVVWRNHFGQAFTLVGEDPAASTPDVVDQEDYVFWQTRFGETAGAGLAVIPEPVSGGLLIVGLLLATAVSRTRRRELT
jgi:hypothetical protein